MTLRHREYLGEGKAISMERPKLSSMKPSSDQKREWKRLIRVWESEVRDAVDKVLTWKSDNKDFVSQHSVVRVGRTGGGRVDYVFQIYDLDPDSKKKPPKIRVNVYNKDEPRQLFTIAHVKSLREARKAAKNWLKGKAVLMAANKLQRISFRSK